MQVNLHHRSVKESRRWKECSYPAAERTPYGDTGAKVPQDPDDNDAGAQPIGSGLGTQAKAGEGDGGGRRGGEGGHEEEQQL